MPRTGSSLALLVACLAIGPVAAARSEETRTGPALRPRPFAITPADRAYWAFQPVRRPPVPGAGASEQTARHPVDAFVGARLAEAGLEPNPPASPREQVRRVCFDLTGLPPAPEEVAAFEQQPDDAAWARLVDRLSNSPAYGERWGRHWLDLVRYAESNGYERDGEKPNAWRYRDYVIRSFNEDKPYDRFVREQLAGDELAEDLPPGTPEWRDAIVATGFYRFHVWDDEPDSTLKAEFDDLDDILVTTGTAFLGLTVGCARCHDHKFDPVSQTDYYSLLAFVRGIDPYGQHHEGGGGRGTGRIERVLAAPDELTRWRSEQAERARDAEGRIGTAADDATRKRFEDALKALRNARPPFDHALAVAEEGPNPKPTRVLFRGDVLTPRDEVAPAFPAVLGVPSPVLTTRPAGATTSGRRRLLADWVADPANPLTARVLVNRLWQHHLGVGIVATPDDFGLTGIAPSNQPLLDFLAAELIEGGWRLKRLHRLILTSQAYRRSSRAEHPRALAVDEPNARWWRQNPRRLEAEAVRDSILAVSGVLNLKRGGPSIFPTLPKEVHGTQDSAGKGWQDSPPEEQLRRSVYLVVKRALRIPILDCFDFANGTSGTGNRPVTTTAPQSLMLLNDRLVATAAEAFAERLAREAGGGRAERIDRAFRLAFQRAPAEGERRLAERFLEEQGTRARQAGAAAPEQRALASFCRSLLNASELIHID